MKETAAGDLLINLAWAWIHQKNPCLSTWKKNWFHLSRGKK